MRAILTMDATGTAAAAHTVSAQMFQLCLIAVLALSTLASILIPQKLNAAKGEGGPEQAKICADRLLVWGFLLGVFLACVQLTALPALKFFTPLENVQAMAAGPGADRRDADAAQRPGVRGGGPDAGAPGVREARGGMCVSTTLMLGALKVWGHTVEGVWGCFFVFNVEAGVRPEASLCGRTARAGEDASGKVEPVRGKVGRTDERGAASSA